MHAPELQPPLFRRTGMIELLLLLTLAAVAPADEPPVKGRLCWTPKGECVDTSGTSIRFTPADAERLFVWRTADGVRVVIGRAAAGADSVDVAAKDLRTIAVAIGGNARRGWPADTRFVLRQGKAAAWEWSVPALQVKALREIAVPAGDYELAIGAPRHKLNRRRLPVRQNVALSDIELEPLPAVSGRFVQRKGEETLPVAGANIVRDEGKVEASSGVDGTFRIELAEPLPKQLLVLHPSLATHLLELERLQPENDLGDIALSSGVKVVLQISRPEEGAEKVRVRVLRDAGRYELVPLTSHELPVGQEELVLSNLARGKYHVVLEGDDPLEYQHEELEVGENETRESFAIKPYRLRGSVRFGDEPLREGSVELSSRPWRRQGGQMPLDASGNFGGTLWQHGKLSGFIKGEAIGSGLPVSSPEMGSDPSEWKIELKRRLIEGVVVDAASGQPLPGVSMDLKVRSGDTRSFRSLNTSVKVDEAGRYRITAVQDGTYDIVVQHASRTPVKRSVELRPNDGSQRIDFRLEEGLETRIELVWPDGRPVTAAMVIEGMARDGHNPERLFSTDGAGRLTVRSAPRERRTLFVLPREGSFAVVRIDAPAAGAEPKTMRVVVPAATGSIGVTIRNAKDEPLNAIVLMRYNGEWIPYPAVGRLRFERRGVGSIRFQNMPPGAYELWAVKPPGDHAPHVTAPPPLAPVLVGLAGGEESAVLTAHEPR